MWHLRHWLQFWQSKTWIHDNLCYLTIKSDTGQHSQFLQCLSFLSTWVCLCVCVRVCVWVGGSADTWKTMESCSQEGAGQPRHFRPVAIIIFHVLHGFFWPHLWCTVYEWGPFSGPHSRNLRIYFLQLDGTPMTSLLTTTIPVTRGHTLYRDLNQGQQATPSLPPVHCCGVPWFNKYLLVPQWRQQVWLALELFYPVYPLLFDRL